MLGEVLAHVERASRSPSGLASCPELDPLTTMPLLAIENGPNGIDCKLEAELAELPEEEAAAFRDGPSALDEVVRRLQEALGLITFFTVGDKERARGRCATARPRSRRPRRSTPISRVASSAGR